MTPRAATLADAPQIAAIWNAVIRDTAITFTTTEKTSGDIQTLIASGDAIGVAEQDGAVTGFALWAPFRSGPGYAATKEITIYISSDAQGQGTGAAMMDWLVTAAKANDVTHLVAGIGSENERVVGFFERAGFRQVGHLPGVGHKFGREMDLILMLRRLVG